VIVPLLVLGRIQMIQCPVSLLRLPGEGRDPFPRWAPAFAGVTEFLVVALVRRRPMNRLTVPEH